MIGKSIKEYYESLKQLESLERKLNNLYDMKVKIDKDIAEGNIHLASDIASISYDSIKTKNSSGHQSQQEHAIDAAYKELYSELTRIKTAIITAETEVIKIKRKIIDVELFINSLTEDERYLLEQRYKYKKTLTAIALDTYMSDSGIKRKITRIINKGIEQRYFKD